MKVIILAGGSGSRLWPLSREKYPKQFIKIPGRSRSLFQDTITRSLLLTTADNIYIVTNKSYKFLVTSAMKELGVNCDENNILIEPEAKNTLPAVYAGVHAAMKKGDDTAIVFSSDHVILKDNEFIELIKATENLAKDYLITFGIPPETPNTGYGYISPGKAVGNGYIVKDFKEKPDTEKAKDYINKGYYWNAGIFMFGMQLLTDEVIKYSKDLYEAFDSTNCIDDAFSKIDVKISFDYGILEKSSRVAVVPANIGWNDLGSYDSFYSVFDADKAGNIVTDENNIYIDASNTVVLSEQKKLAAIIGVDDLMVIDSMDSLLICKKGQSQKVKDVVDTLKKRNDTRAEYHVQDCRPWGSYRILEEVKDAFKIKRITVSPGERLSYQFHYHRSEHWVVVKGTARVIINKEEFIVRAGESIYIKSGEKHSLENPGKIPLEVIEVQLGDYLEEDDIIRLDDVYKR